MNYIETIIEAMQSLAGHPDRRFVGYNVCDAGGAFGKSLAAIPAEQRIEMPVAENLMAGVAIGLSIHGFKPVLCFERFDFVLNALDAIVNHLDKIAELSDGQFKPAVIIRIVVGNRNGPLFTGPPHVQNFSAALRLMVKFPVIELKWVSQIRPAYEQAAADQLAGRSTALVEFKDMYQITS